MALIKCPKCGEQVSDQAKACPKCGCIISSKQGFNKKYLILIAAFILIIAVPLAIKEYNRVQLEKQRIAEEQRQEKISQLLTSIDASYKNADFPSVLNLLDELDGLSYDTSEARNILAYNEEVYPVAHDFYNTIVETDKIMKNRSTSSLNALAASLRDPFKKFDDLPINEDTPIGQYIKKVRNNVMYSTFKSEFLYSSNSFDIPLTQGGYFIIMEIYTDELASIEFPYS